MKNLTQAEMERLQFLIGKWNTEGEIIAHDRNAATKFKGTDTYEWILDGHFILHKVDVEMNNEKILATEIIGEFDGVTKRYKMRSFDNHGVFTEMEGHFDEQGTFHILGDKMRSKLSVTDSNTLTAHWENSVDNQTWLPWMDLTLTKQSAR
jgi:hypothetical protein